MTRLVAIAALLVFSGCSSALQTLPLTASPSAASLDLSDAVAQRPAGAGAAALATCAGLRFDPARVLLECDDDQQVYLIRYAAEPDAAVCRRLVGANLRGVALAPGPALALPARTEVFSATAEGPPGLPPRPAVAACAPAAGGGALLAITFGGDAGRVLPALAWGGLPAGLDGVATPDSVDVFGRALWVHPSCRLLEPRNLQCESDGQMSWSRFSSAAAAEAAAEAHAVRVLANASETFVDERVGCRFEGVPTVCRRIAAQVSFGALGNLLTAGQSRRLVIVVAAADVRGQHAQAECSFFDDQAAPGALATLCRESFDIDA
jgi:hypothetical protein